MNAVFEAGQLLRAYRAARIDALKQTSDFAKLLGIDKIQTHCGFIPENPHDPLYEETVAAIRAPRRRQPTHRHAGDGGDGRPMPGARACGGQSASV